MPRIVKKDNAIVGGMSRADFSGNPYIVSGDVDGKYVYVAVPAATAALRKKIEGVLAKVNLKTWKVEQAIPVGDPIWPEVSLDGKTAWVTMGGHSKVAKIDLVKGQVIDEITTGPGPWGARLSYDGTKLYTADKGEAYGYGQQGRTMNVIDTENNIATNVVAIGLTTDHIILSPDGKELWATSNADHSIVVVDTETEEVKGTVKMPNNGDTHGSTFVEYRSDGKGGVGGEVVASFTGLRGSALAKQKEQLKGEKTQTVKITPYNAFFAIPGSFNPGALTLFVFSLGIAVPLVVAAVAMAQVLPLLGKLERVAPWMALASSAIMIGFALLLITDNYHVVSNALAGALALG